MAALATETQDGASSPIPEVYVGTHGRSMQGVNRTSIGLFNIYIYIYIHSWYLLITWTILNMWVSHNDLTRVVTNHYDDGEWIVFFQKTKIQT